MMLLFGLVALALLVVINAAPLAFFLMLFLGNVGLNYSFLAILPAAIAIKCIATNILAVPEKTK